MNPQKEEKDGEDICVLELLNIPKPLKESCFSEEQIDMLFNLWREFMYEKFSAGESFHQAKQDVDRLYSTASTIKRKYNALRLDNNTGYGVLGGTKAPALDSHEKHWVMGIDSPTPFIKFLRSKPQVMEILRMSFKPELMHGGMLEAPDFAMILLRYLYWLRDDRERKMNLLGISDDYEKVSTASTPGSTIDNMVSNLQQNWSYARFHVAVLNEDMHWRAVLIDRHSKTFEYYDPMGHDVDLKNQSSPLSQQISSLYETARSLDDQLTTLTMKSVRRGFNIHQRSGTECGMYVILFIHTRVSQKKSFKEFVNTEITSQKCKDLKEVFFTMPGRVKFHEDTKSNREYRIKFGSYDIRLAGLEFVRYMNYVQQITEVPQVRNRIAEDQNRFLNMLSSPGDYVPLRVEGMKIQKDVLSALPNQFKTYAGSDIWFSIIQEIVQDPLTRNLRKISTEGAKRSRNTVRRKMALKLFNDIVGWSHQIGAPEPHINALNSLMQELIDNYYVTILHFNADNHKRFEVGMLPQAFLRETMTRKETVGFGVHFLREVNNFVTKKLQINTHSELDSRFAVSSMVVKPVSIKNMNEIKTRINQCDAAIQQAYALLQNTFADRMMMPPSGTSVSPNFGAAPSPFPAGSASLGNSRYYADTPTPAARPFSSTRTSYPSRRPFSSRNSLSRYPASTTDMMAPPPPPPVPSFAGPTNDTRRVEQIIVLNKQDMENKTFLSDNQIKPYNFPVNVPEFNSSQSEVLPPEFNLYSVNETDMRRLMSSELFRVYYAMEVLIAQHYIATGLLKNPLSIHVILVSLVQFYNVTKNQASNRHIMCTLINQMYNSVTSEAARTIPGLQHVIDFVARFNQACEYEDAVDSSSPFFQKVNAEFQAIYHGYS